MEEWRDIRGYEGYQVSNLGRVRTHNKTTYTKRHGTRHWKDRILAFKPSTSSSQKSKQGMGYRVDLWKNGKPKTLLVARLVATTFLEDLIDTNMTVNHKDGNRLNNNVENLEWVTIKDNVIHAFETNLQTTQKHIAIINTKTGAKARFRSMSQAGMFFGNSHGFISAIIKNGQNTFRKNDVIYLVEVD